MDKFAAYFLGHPLRAQKTAKTLREGKETLASVFLWGRERGNRTWIPGIDDTG